MGMNIFSFGIYSHNPRWWLRNIKQFFKNIKYAWQRATRGFSDPDCWEFDSYLSRIISGGLKTLDKNRHGFPTELYSQLGEEDGNQEWSKILSEISAKMEKYEQLKSSEYPPGNLPPEAIGEWYENNQKEAENTWNSAIDLLKKWHNDMWD